MIRSCVPKISIQIAWQALDEGKLDVVGSSRDEAVAMNTATAPVQRDAEEGRPRHDRVA
jgi:hypothetical protein